MDTLQQAFTKIWNQAGSMAAACRAGIEAMKAIEDYEQAKQDVEDLLTAKATVETVTPEEREGKIAVINTTMQRASADLPNKIGVRWNDKTQRVELTTPKARNKKGKAKDRFSELAAKLKNKSITLNEYAEFMDLVRDMAPQS